MAYYSQQRNAGTLKFNVTPRIRFNPRVARVGALKTAYLAAFCKFGYLYAFDQRLERVRDQIRDPDSKILPNWWILPTDTYNEDWPAIIALEQPVEAIAVYLQTSVVILPWVGNVPDPYPQVADGTLTLSGSPRPWPTGMEMLLDFEGQG